MSPNTPFCTMGSLHTSERSYTSLINFIKSMGPYDTQIVPSSKLCDFFMVSRTSRMRGIIFWKVLEKKVLIKSYTPRSYLLSVIPYFSTVLFCLMTKSAICKMTSPYLQQTDILRVP